MGHRIPTLACSTMLLAAAAGAQQTPFTAGSWAAAINGFATVDLRTSGPTAWGVDLGPQLSWFVINGLSLDATGRGAWYGFGSGSKQVVAAGPGVSWYAFSLSRTVTPFVSTRVQFARYREAFKSTAAVASGTEWRTSGGVVIPMGPSNGLQIGAWYELSRFRFDQSHQAARAPQGQTGLFVGVLHFLQKTG